MLLVGTEAGLYQFGGPDHSQAHLADHAINAVAREGDGWWALTDGSRLWRSAPSARWEAVAEVRALRANCLCPSGSGLLVGASNARLLRLADAALEPVESFDGIEGRDEWYTPWGGPPD